MRLMKRRLNKIAVEEKDGRNGTERAYARCRKLRHTLMAKVKNSSSDSSAA